MSYSLKYSLCVLLIEVIDGDAGDVRCAALEQELEAERDGDEATDERLHDEATHLEVQPLGDEAAKNLAARRSGHYYDTCRTEPGHAAIKVGQ